jgi:hypothetical protein
MKRALVACLLVAGCAEQPVEHGNAALGVSDFVVRATASELDIAGTDPQGTVLTRFHLRTGMVTPEDWDTPTLGRELSFEIMGKAYRPFASAGLAPLALPLTADPYLNTFVLDRFVAPILTRWGIAFADHVRVDEPEVGYSQCATNTVTYTAPCNGYGASSTCYDFWGYSGGNAMWSQKVVCADPAQTRAERLCASAGVVTPCGTAGPNGCAVCGTAGNGGWATCVNDSCVFGSAGGGGGGGGGGGSCNGTGCQLTCGSDDDCCSCGGYCGFDGTCVY